MKRSLADWASIAEILGAIAVVVSLLFVGLQVRANTRASQAATYQEQLGLEIGVLSTAAANPGLARLYSDTFDKGDFEGFNEEESAQAQWLWVATFRLWEGFYLQHLSGAMSPEGWAAREPVVRAISQLPIACTFADDITISGEFEEYVRAQNPMCP